jgi:hypothetical protein
MSFDIRPLLIHSDAVPGPARDALRDALGAPPELRASALESAARVLFMQTGLECNDVRELVGLPDSSGCH